MRDRKNKDLRTLKSTLVYCEDVQSALNRFGKDYEVFAHDRVFFHAISMSVMQVGELANNLSEEFKEKNSTQVDGVGSDIFVICLLMPIVISISGPFGILLRCLFLFILNFADKRSKCCKKKIFKI